MGGKCSENSATSTVPPARDEHAVGAQLLRPEEQLRVRDRRRWFSFRSRHAAREPLRAEEWIRFEFRVSGGERVGNGGGLAPSQRAHGVDQATVRLQRRNHVLQKGSLRRREFAN